MDLKQLYCHDCIDLDNVYMLHIEKCEVIVTMVLVYASLSVYLCVHSPVSHHNFVKFTPIATQLYIVIAGHDICSQENITGIGKTYGSR